MKLPFIYQAVNLMSAIGMIALIVLNLGQGEYLQWILFTTIAGMLIQIEAALNATGVRKIGAAFAFGRYSVIDAAIRSVAGRYRIFAICFVGGMYVGGLAYLARASANDFSVNWVAQWSVFSAAYFIYYVAAFQSCVLIGSGAVNAYAVIGIVSRLTSLATAALFIGLGFGVNGLCASVFLGFGIGTFLFTLNSRRIRKSAMADADDGMSWSSNVSVKIRDIGVYALFLFIAYALYRLPLLIDSGSNSSTARQSGVGLALQIFALIVTFASVPITMRVRPLVNHISDGSTREALKEIVALLVSVNLIYVCGSVAFVVVGASLIQYFPFVKIGLPGLDLLVLLSLCFFVEINILVFVNALIALDDFEFALAYCWRVGLAVGFGVIGWYCTGMIYWWFLPLFLFVQTLFNFPMIFRYVANHLDTNSYAFVAMVGRRSLDVLQNPLSKGILLRH
jgi:hypothetical protein